jgi:hypothetical protein
MHLQLAIDGISLRGSGLRSTHLQLRVQQSAVCQQLRLSLLLCPERWPTSSRGKHMSQRIVISTIDCAVAADTCLTIDIHCYVVPCSRPAASRADTAACCCATAADGTHVQLVMAQQELAE